MQTCPTTINLIRRFQYHACEETWEVGGWRGDERTNIFYIHQAISRSNEEIYKILMGDEKEGFPLQILNTFFYRLIYKFNVILVKILMEFYLEFDKIILNYSEKRSLKSS